MIRPGQFDGADAEFRLTGRRDHRGIRTIVDLSCAFEGRYRLTNGFDEPVHVLFRCPHPKERHSNGTLRISDLNLRASQPGEYENAPDGSPWSGRLGAGAGVEFNMHYVASGLKS